MEEEKKQQEIMPAPINFKSKVWTHFGFYTVPGKTELGMTKAVCKLCHRPVSYCGNTTNMTAHLVRHHPDININQHKRPAAACQQTLDGSLSKLPSSSDKAKRITTSIAHFMCKDLRPYSVVENVGLRNMVYNLEPRYIIPSRKFFSETAIPQIYNEVKSGVKEKLSRAERIALTCDAWTSRATESYVTLTAHHITEDWSLSSHVLQTRAMSECHTGPNDAELLRNVAAEWDISEKDAALMTDNAANMSVAAQLAGFLHIKCYAHTLNLASQRALKPPAVARLLVRVRRVTGFFHRSATACHALEQKQKLLELPVHRLVTDVATRWNSAFDMVVQFLEQQPAVTAALLSLEVRKKEKEISTFTEFDIANAEEFIQAMKPVKVATCVMSDETHATISVIAPLHAQLLRATKETLGDSPFVRELKEAIHQDLLKRYTSEVEKATLNLASALDPRFKSAAVPA